MLILCFGDILSTLADRESVLGVAESQQHVHLRELDRIRHTAEHPKVKKVTKRKRAVDHSEDGGVSTHLPRFESIISHIYKNIFSLKAE